jgi:hypothetical protein
MAVRISILGCVEIALIAVSCLACNSAAGADDTSLADHKITLSNVTVSVDEAKLYGEPYAVDSPVWLALWAQSLNVDSMRVADAPTGWLPIKGTGGKKAAKGKGARPNAWIRTSDVVSEADYRKVIGCWPVKTLVYVGGDYALEVNFDLNGKASVKEWGDDARMNAQPPQQAHVYLANNIAAIKSVKKSGPVFLISGYRPAERKLYPAGDPAKKQELFSDATLKKCSSAPLLADQ